MWKKTLFAAVTAGLIAAPAFADGYRIITSERTSATIGVPILAGNTTPIGAGVNTVRVLAQTTAGFIYFQQTPLAYDATALSGRMSTLGIPLPINVPEVFSVAEGMRWHVQGDGGTSTITVMQVSK